MFSFPSLFIRGISLMFPLFCHCDCSPLSESASTVGAGLAVPAAQCGLIPVSEVFKRAVSSFKVNDWSLFGDAESWDLFKRQLWIHKDKCPGFFSELFFKKLWKVGLIPCITHFPYILNVCKECWDDFVLQFYCFC